MNPSPDSIPARSARSKPLSGLELQPDTASPPSEGEAQPPRRLTPLEAAEWVRVDRNIIYAACSEGSLNHYRVGRKPPGRKILIDLADLESWFKSLKIERQCGPTTPPPKPRPIKPKFRHLKI